MRKILMLSFVVLLGCVSQQYEEPDFLGIENVEVTRVAGTDAQLSGDAIFYNPNDKGIKLKEVNVAVELEGKKIGKISQELATKIPAASEFTVPLNASFDLSDMGIMNGIISILGGKKVKVRYHGSIKVSRFGYPQTIDVDHTEEIKF